MTLVNIGTKNTGFGSPVNLVTTAAVPAGSLIVVGVVEQGTGTIGTGVTDSAGNTYLRAATNAAGTNCVGAAYYCYNCLALASSSSISYTPAAVNGGNDSVGMSACYATGIKTSADPLDAAVTATASSSGGSTHPSVTSGTPSQSGELLIGFALWDALGTAFTQDSTHAAYTTNPALVVNSTQQVGVAGGAVAGGGTSPLTYSPTITNSPWVAIFVGFLPAGGSTTNVNVSISAPATVSIKRSAGKKLAMVAPAAVGLSRGIGKANLSISAPSALTIASAVTRIVAISISAPASLAIAAKSAYLRMLSITSAGVVSLAKSVRIVRSVADPASLALSRAVRIVRSVPGPTTLTLSRAASKSLSVASTGAATALRNIGKGLAVSAPAGLTVAVGKAYVVAVSIAASAVVSLAKSAGAIRSISAPASLTLRRAIGRVLAIPAPSAISLRRAIARGLSIPATAAVILSRSVSKVLALTAPASLTIAVSRVRVMVLTIASSGTVSLRRAVAKGLDIAAPASLAIIVSKVRTLVLAIAAPATIAIVRGVWIGRSIAAPAVVGLTKAVSIVQNIASLGTVILSYVSSIRAHQTPISARARRAVVGAIGIAREASAGPVRGIVSARGGGGPVSGTARRNSVAGDTNGES